MLSWILLLSIMGPGASGRDGILRSCLQFLSTARVLPPAPLRATSGHPEGRGSWVKQRRRHDDTRRRGSARKLLICQIVTAWRRRKRRMGDHIERPKSVI